MRPATSPTKSLFMYPGYRSVVVLAAITVETNEFTCVCSHPASVLSLLDGLLQCRCDCMHCVHDCEDSAHTRHTSLWTPHDDKSAWHISFGRPSANMGRRVLLIRQHVNEHKGGRESSPLPCGSRTFSTQHNVHV